jgi:hypothetical protein
MKIQIKWRNLIVETHSCSPDRLAKALSKHFNQNWETLTSLGLSLNPPPGTLRSPQAIREECTEPDGSVWGTRFFDVLPPGYLVSPTSKWVWETASQVVPLFSNSEAVRGRHGFHAAWVPDLQNWLDADVDHHETKCKALVKGWGDIILGEVGWRSSKMTVKQAYVKETDVVALSRRYPEVLFQVSSRSFLIETFYFDFPHDIRKLTKWIRDQSLKNLDASFS